MLNSVFFNSFFPTQATGGSGTAGNAGNSGTGGNAGSAGNAGTGGNAGISFGTQDIFSIFMQMFQSWQGGGWGQQTQQPSYGQTPSYTPPPPPPPAYTSPSVGYTYTPPPPPPVYNPPPPPPPVYNPPPPPPAYTPPPMVYEPPAPSYDPSQPYVIDDLLSGRSGNPQLPFSADNAPSTIMYRDVKYEKVKNNSDKYDLRYKAATKQKDGWNNLRIKFTGKDQTVNVGGGNYDYNNYEETTYGSKIKLTSPIALDIDGGGITTTGISTTFDIDGDGTLDQTAWFGSGEGVLALDSNGDGIAGSSGLELFGNHTDLNGDGVADGFNNGFEALNALAAQTLGTQAVADGKLDAAEILALEQSAGLALNINGQTVSLTDAGVTELGLGFGQSRFVDANGNEHRQVGNFRLNGQFRTMIDIWLQQQV